MRISDWSSDVCSSDLPVAGHRISPFGAYPNARSRQTSDVCSSDLECNPLCHDLNPKNPRVIPVNINLASEKGHRQLTRKTLINITKQLTAIINRCKENHCMNDFSGLCLNRSFNFTGCKDCIGQSHTRHRHRTEDYIDSQVLNLMLTVIEGVYIPNTKTHNIQGKKPQRTNEIRSK